MSKKTSKTIRLGSLSQTTGISTDILQQVLDGEFYYQPVVFTNKQSFAEDNLKNVPVLKKKQNFRVSIRQRTTLDEIQESEEVSELWEILGNISASDSEYLPCYDKLISKIEARLKDDNNEDELEELLSCSPLGSLVERKILEELTCIRKLQIQNENDLHELIKLYEKDEFEGDLLDLLVEKILTIVKDPEETKMLLDDRFPDNSLYYYSALALHDKLLKNAISEMISSSDAVKLDDLILFEGDDMEILLVERIVFLEKDNPENIWFNEDIFQDGSEAKEILAFGVIAATTKYDVNQNDALHSVSNTHENCSRVGRAANAKLNVLFNEYIQSLGDVNEVKELLDSFDDGDPCRKLTEEWIIDKCGEDQLTTIIDEDNENYLMNLAMRKRNAIIFNKISSAKKIEDIVGYVDIVDNIENRELTDSFYGKIVSLCNNITDIGDITFPDQSYSMYLLAKKFLVDQSNISDQEAVSENKMPDETKNLEVVIDTEEDRNKKQEEAFNYIKTITDCSEIMMFCKAFSFNDANKKNAYLRASNLLNKELQKENTDARRLKYLLTIFPARSSEWGSIIKALSNFYKKNWFENLFTV